MNGKPPQSRGLTAIDGAMVLVIILLIVQIWLLSATLESYLAGHREASVPGAIISVVSGGVGTLLVVLAVATIWPQLRHFGRLDAS